MSVRVSVGFAIGAFRCGLVLPERRNNAGPNLMLCPILCPPPKPSVYRRELDLSTSSAYCDLAVVVGEHRDRGAGEPSTAPREVR
jgi:hypothetical protein